MTRSLVLVLAALGVSCTARGEGAAQRSAVPAPAYDSAFWTAWGDGQAELAGYTLTRPRYGEMRKGKAVLVFVTEPWSLSGHVKADEGKHPKDDVIQVLKLNAVEDFQTGIYDYNLMTTSWTAIMGGPGRPAGAAAKVAFSAQEWCGTTWADVVFDARGAQEIVRSYFDGETGVHVLENPAARGRASLVEDALLVWARGLAAPVVASGARADVAFLPALSRARLQHTRLAWTTATLARDAAKSTVTVPAGTFEVERATVTVAEANAGDGAGAKKSARTIEVLVEAKAPRRIVKVTMSDGTVMELKGSLRTPYWQKNHEGDEALLEAVGLEALGL